jgi:2-methylaconitate cis-trans-isomerase PrpF
MERRPQRRRASSQTQLPNAIEEWRKEPATKGGIIDLVQQAIRNVAVPRVMALIGTLEDKFKKMGDDVHSFKIRVSCMEQDP